MARPGPRAALVPLLALASLAAAADPVWTHVADYTDTRAMAVHDGRLVGASSRGAWTYDPAAERWEHFSLPQGLSSIDLTAVGVDEGGMAFLAGVDASLSAFSPGDGTVSRGWSEFRDHPQIQAINGLSASGEHVLVSHSTGVTAFDYLPASDEFLVEWNLHAFGDLPAQNPILAAAATGDWLVVAGEGGLAWGQGWPDPPASFQSWLAPGAASASGGRSRADGSADPSTGTSRTAAKPGAAPPWRSTVGSPAQDANPLLDFGTISSARLLPVAGGLALLASAPDGEARAWRFEDGAWTRLWPDRELQDAVGFASGPRLALALAEGTSTRLLFDEGDDQLLARSAVALAWTGDTLWTAVAPDRRPGGLLPWTAAAGFGELHAPAVLGVEEVLDLDFDAAGHLWAVGVAENSARNGLFRLEDDGGWTAVRLGYDRFGEGPVCVHGDSERGVWAGTWGRGLLWLDLDGGPGDTLRYANDDSLAPPGQHLRGFDTGGDSNPSFVLVTDLVEDAEGNLWGVNHMADDDSSVFALPAAWRQDRSTPFQRVHYDRQGSSALFPYKLLAADAGDLWISTGGKDGGEDRKRLLHLMDRGRSLARLDEWLLREVELADGRFNFGVEESGVVSALALDADDQVWAATDAGAYYGGFYASSEQFSRVQFISGLLSESNTALATDSRGRVWMGSSLGLNVFLPRELRFEEPQEVEAFNRLARKLGTLSVNRILLDEATGGIWVASNAGLFHCDSGARSYGAAPGTTVRFHPNPFRPDADGTVRIAAESLANDAEAVVYDLDGRRLRRLALDEIERGWDGRDDAGRPLDSGVYLVLVTSSGGSAAGKLAILR